MAKLSTVDAAANRLFTLHRPPVHLPILLEEKMVRVSWSAALAWQRVSRCTEVIFFIFFSGSCGGGGGVCVLG